MSKAGTIVLIPFPFTDLSESKVRPALVVSKQPIGENVVVVFISSQTKQKHQFDVLIQPSSQNGLKTASLIKCAKIATLDTKISIGEIGKLSKADISKVKRELKKLFL